MFRMFRLNQKGSALLISLFCISLLMYMAAAFLSMSVNNYKMEKFNADSTKAMWIAEAGIAQIIHDLRYSYFTNAQRVEEKEFGGGKYKVGSITLRGLGIHETLIAGVGEYKERKYALSALITIDTPTDYAAFYQGDITIGGNTGTQIVIGGPVYVNGDVKVAFQGGGGGYGNVRIFKANKIYGPALSLSGYIYNHQLSFYGHPAYAPYAHCNNCLQLGETKEITYTGNECDENYALYWTTNWTCPPMLEGAVNFTKDYPLAPNIYFGDRGHPGYLYREYSGEVEYTSGSPDIAWPAENAPYGILMDKDHGGFPIDIPLLKRAQYKGYIDEDWYIKNTDFSYEGASPSAVINPAFKEKTLLATVSDDTCQWSLPSDYASYSEQIDQIYISPFSGNMRYPQFSALIRDKGLEVVGGGVKIKDKICIGYGEYCPIHVGPPPTLKNKYPYSYYVVRDGYGKNIVWGQWAYIGYVPYGGYDTTGLDVIGVWVGGVPVPEANYSLVKGWFQCTGGGKYAETDSSWCIKGEGPPGNYCEGGYWEMYKVYHVVRFDEGFEPGIGKKVEVAIGPTTLKTRYIYLDKLINTVKIDLDKINTFPKDGVIFSEVPVEVRGNPSEPVTIVSMDDIYVGPINADLPDDDPRAKSVGLISKGKIWLNYQEPYEKYLETGSPDDGSLILNKVALGGGGLYDKLYMHTLHNTGGRRGINMRKIVGSIYADQREKALPDLEDITYESYPPYGTSSSLNPWGRYRYSPLDADNSDKIHTQVLVYANSFRGDDPVTPEAEGPPPHMPFALVIKGWKGTSQENVCKFLGDIALYIENKEMVPQDIYKSISEEL